MIEQYNQPIPHNQRHDDDFYERFLEQRIGKLNSFTEPLAEDPFPFPIRPLPTALSVTSHKRDSVTSSDSGVGLPQVLLPTFPITPEQLPPHPQETATDSRQLRLQPDHLLRLNNFCGKVESPKRENQGTSDLSHTSLISICSLYPHTPG